MESDVTSTKKAFSIAQQVGCEDLSDEDPLAVAKEYQRGS
jgi:hypothetical protein